MGFEGRCRVTGIGSLAFTSVAEALDSVFEFAPGLPYLPQLPRLSPNEGMNEQMYEGMPGLDRRDGKWLIVQNDTFFEAVALLFERFEHPDEDAGAISPRCSAALAPFLERVRANGLPEAKAQVAGPVTVGMSLLDEEGTPILYNDVLRDVLVKHLSLKVRWLARQIGATGARPVIFVDEPFLTSFGTPFFGWTRPEQPREVIEQVYAAAPIKGTHCCANTDWTIFLQSSAEIVSFDAFGYATAFLTYREALADFIRRGGNIAWGIVPTDPEALAATSAAELLDRLRQQIDKLASWSLDPAAILRQSLITPSCGLGSRPPEATRPAFALARQVSEALRAGEG